MLILECHNLYSAHVRPGRTSNDIKVTKGHRSIVIQLGLMPQVLSVELVFYLKSVFICRVIPSHWLSPVTFISIELDEHVFTKS